MESSKDGWNSIESLNDYDERRRKERIEKIEQAAQEEIETPAGVKAASAISNMRPDELSVYQDVEAINEQKRRGRAEQWRFENEDSRVLAHQRFARILAETQQQIQSRLVNKQGDAIVNANGEIVGYRPPRLRELDSLQASTLDRMLALEKRILGETDDGRPKLPFTPEELWERLAAVARNEKVVAEVRGEYNDPAEGESDANAHR